MIENTRVAERRLLMAAFAGFGILTILTALLAPGLVNQFYPLTPDKGPAWYFWQLPNPTTLTRITYWAGYGLHQIAIFVILFLAMKRAGAGEPKPSTGSSFRFNVIALAVNLAFVALHLVQTHLWYDGLAQDVPIWTSQGSVIVMLVLLLYLEIPRRGLIWGRKLTPPATLYRFLRKWHGIYIAWALTYTFWFHPMDGNWGLLSGFVYMFLLFIQLSMFSRPIHFNLGWVVLLEAFVAVHATLITVYKDNPIWPMFMVGFLIMLVFTQMHSIRFAYRYRWPIAAAFVVMVAALYIFVRGVEHLYEITFIPVALYGGTLALLAIGWAIERIVVVRSGSNV